jgi:hypothetical protein
MGLRPGLPDLAETTTALALFFIHASALSSSVDLKAPTTSLIALGVCLLVGFGSTFKELVALCRKGLLDGDDRVGSREGMEVGGRTSLETAAAAAACFAAEEDLVVVVSFGILLGGSLRGTPIVGVDAEVFRDFLIKAAPAVERVTLAGLASLAVTPLLLILLGRLTGTTPRAGRISLESSSESRVCILFVTGVFLGWPGGVIAPALAAASATCRLGVTGGIGRVRNSVVGVSCTSCIASVSSDSAGGVAGVTRAELATLFADCACALRSSSTAAHFAHSNCLRYIYCCCGPTTLPGRTIRMKAIASLAVKPYFHIRYAPMRLPVLPRPALH